MNELARRFRIELQRTQFDKLEGTWLELMDSDADLEALLALVEAARPTAPPETVRTLLWVLADGLKEKGQHGGRLRVLKELAQMLPDDPRLALELAECYRQSYTNTDNIEKLLGKSGLGYGGPSNRAAATMDALLSMTPGSGVYDEENGPGRVQRIDLLLDRVTVNFSSGKRVALELSAAGHRLRPNRPGGFFDRLHGDSSSLETLAKSEPSELVLLYLKDVEAPMEAGTLKTELSGIVGKSSWNGFWDKARKALMAHPHVSIRSTPARTFQWSSRPVAKETTRSRSARTALRERISETEVAGMSEQEAVSFYKELGTSPGRKRFLECVISSGRKDWPALVSKLFRIGADRRVRGLIEKQLSTENPDDWTKLLKRVLTGYRQNPEAFLWVVENHGRLGVDEAYGMLTRSMDLLESGVERSVATGLRNALVADEYRLVRDATEQADETRARGLLDRIGRIPGFEKYKRDEMAGLVVERFPALAEPKVDTSLLSSRPGLERARQKLERLTREELPKTAEEIAQARAHGDLSENYEYKAAKEKQARLMASIKRLQTDVMKARVVGPEEVDPSLVSFGCRVTLEEQDGEVLKYSVLGPWDSDPEHGIISYLAPIAGQLMGKKPGDAIELQGKLFKITDISAALPG